MGWVWDVNTFNLFFGNFYGEEQKMNEEINIGFESLKEMTIGEVLDISTNLEDGK